MCRSICEAQRSVPGTKKKKKNAPLKRVHIIIIEQEHKYFLAVEYCENKGTSAEFLIYCQWSKSA